MSQKPTFQEGVKHVLTEITTKEKILLVAQAVLSITIICLAILGFTGILQNSLVNLLALSLLSILFIVSAIRVFPEKKLSFSLYLIGAVLLILSVIFVI